MELYLNSQNKINYYLNEYVIALIYARVGMCILLCFSLYSMTYRNTLAK